MADTRFSYSRLFSWYSWAAWLLAGLLGFGSSSRDWREEEDKSWRWDVECFIWILMPFCVWFPASSSCFRASKRCFENLRLLSFFLNFFFYNGRNRTAAYSPRCTAETDTSETDRGAHTTCRTCAQRKQNFLICHLNFCKSTKYLLSLWTNYLSPWLLPLKMASLLSITIKYRQKRIINQNLWFLLTIFWQFRYNCL